MKTNDISTDNAIRNAYQKLCQGNARFAAGKRLHNTPFNPDVAQQLAEGQAPFACVLACSDSRVPVETVFDQGLGDLFVIRIAGNIVLPSQIGSIEFAASKFGTPLVVVMGHSQCGAVQACLQQLDDKTEPPSPHLAEIINCIMPAVDTPADTATNQQSRLDKAVDANIRHSVEELTQHSEILRQLTQEGKIRIIGARYQLENGKVVFLDKVE